MTEKITKVLSLLENAKMLILELEEEVVKTREVTDERLSMPISVLKLSRRAKYGISDLEVTTIGELVRFTESDLMSLRNIGSKTLREISEELSKIGLQLGDNVSIRQQKINEILSHIKR